jgi:hypothetical protein
MVDLDLNTNLNSSNKFLFLDGYGIDVRVDDGKLVIKDGNGVKQTFFSIELRLRMVYVIPSSSPSNLNANMLPRWSLKTSSSFK